MKTSKCCNAKVHEQNGLTYCSNCISIISNRMINKNRTNKHVYFVLSVFVALFTCVNANAPSSKLKLIHTVLENKFEDLKYKMDCFQIKIIESNDRSNAVSVKGAIGKMQIVPIALADWNLQHPKEQYQIKDMFNEYINQKVGCWLLEKRIPEILKCNKSPIKVNYILISYNWGFSNFIVWYNNGGVYSQLPDETRDYICKYWQKF